MAAHMFHVHSCAYLPLCACCCIMQMYHVHTHALRCKGSLLHSVPSMSNRIPLMRCRSGSAGAGATAASAACAAAQHTDGHVSTALSYALSYVQVDLGAIMAFILMPCSQCVLNSDSAPPAAPMASLLRLLTQLGGNSRWRTGTALPVEATGRRAVSIGLQDLRGEGLSVLAKE